MAKEARIMLHGSLSHTVKLPGQNEVRFAKGVPHQTTNEALIGYAQARPQWFSVSAPKAVAKPAPRPAPEPEEPEEPEADEPEEPEPEDTEPADEPEAPAPSRARKPRSRKPQVG
jgi:hypothetical protein